MNAQVTTGDSEEKQYNFRLSLVTAVLVYHLIQPSWKMTHFFTFGIFTLFVANFHVICTCKESKQQTPSKRESVTKLFFNI